MQWEKLERSYQALESILHSLRPADHFNLILFNSEVSKYSPNPVTGDPASVQKALDLPGGLSVAQAAERLEVSEPTIRKWLAEGLLERVEGHKPVEVTQRSVIEVERVLGTVRESYPARRWSEALAAFLHDRDLLGQGWAREGVEQLREGELIER